MLQGLPELFEFSIDSSCSLESLWVIQSSLRVAGTFMDLYLSYKNTSSAWWGEKIDKEIDNFFKVLPNDIDDVAKEILAGVEEALSEKKKEYITTNVKDVQKFSLEVNFVIQ